MNLQPCQDTYCLTVKCLGCGKSVALKAAYADLDGPAFEAYYCADCAEKLDAPIYQRVKELGIECASHESDLYIPVNDTTKRLVNEYRFKSNVTTFVAQDDKKLWYDIPFAYLPFWDKARR